MGLVEEVLVAAKSVAFEKWQNIYSPPDGTGNPDSDKGVNKHFYPRIISGSWDIVAGDEEVNMDNKRYVRYLYIENVCRDKITGAIATAISPPCTLGNSNDPSSQKITSVVSWTGGSIERSTYLTRWHNKICNQTDWSGIGSGPSNCPATIYENSASIDAASVPGSIKLQSQ